MIAIFGFATFACSENTSSTIPDIKNNENLIQMKVLFEKGVINDFISSEIKVDKKYLEEKKIISNTFKKIKIPTTQEVLTFDYENAVISKFEIAENEVLSIPIFREGEDKPSLVYHKSMTNNASLVLEVVNINDEMFLNVYDTDMNLVKSINRNQMGKSLKSTSNNISDFGDWLDCVGGNWRNTFDRITGEDWYVGVLCMVEAPACVIGFTAVFAIGCAL